MKNFFVEHLLFSVIFSAATAFALLLTAANYVASGEKEETKEAYTKWLSKTQTPKQNTVNGYVKCQDKYLILTKVQSFAVVKPFANTKPAWQATLDNKETYFCGKIDKGLTEDLPHI